MPESDENPWHYKSSIGIQDIEKFLNFVLLDVSSCTVQHNRWTQGTCVSFVSILFLIFRIFQWSWLLFFIVLFSFCFFVFFFLRYQSLSERKVTLELAWKNLNKWKFEPSSLLIYLTAWLVMPEKHSVLKQDSKFIACARRNLGVAHPRCCDSRVLGVLMFFMLAVTLVAQ